MQYLRSTENFTRNFLSYGTLNGWSGLLEVTIKDGGRPPYWKLNDCHNSTIVDYKHPSRVLWHCRLAHQTCRKYYRLRHVM